MNKKEYNVLIADDLVSIRFAIRDYLHDDFNIYEAGDGMEAIDILNQHKIDFVLTDIRMPEMGGIELIEHMKIHFPRVPFALMTAYNVNDYIEYARKYGILNIIPKTTLLDLAFVKTMILKILSGDIFGIEKYYPGIQKVRLDSGIEALKNTADLRCENVFYTLEVPSLKDADRICDFAAWNLIRLGSPTYIRQVLDELTSNAMIYGAGMNRKYEGESSEHIDISFGKRGPSLLISVTDYRGTLNSEEILFRLERHLKMDPATGLPIGIGDNHGRGLFISREELDHLIFNILPGEKTEIIGIIQKDSELKNRSLSIYESVSIG
jgi:CheY-like chemotaxis protein